MCIYMESINRKYKKRKRKKTYTLISQEIATKSDVCLCAHGNVSL